MTPESPSAAPHIEHARMSTFNSYFRPSFSRCTQCNPQRRENTRNLVVCIDGTSNEFGQNNTNVVKLFAQIDLETTQPEQYACYFSGIGTRPKPVNRFDRMKIAVSDICDMAVAWNIRENVMDAYGWLARMYQKGDQIYLFGFSRGAYQVRILAGMIHEVGLIRTPMDKQVSTVYNHYEAIRSGNLKARQLAREYKNAFSWKDLRVHFVGVWDTVSSVGLIRGNVFLPSAAHGCHFRHALALDEIRVKFMPEYAHEMNPESNDGKSKYDAECVATPGSEWRESAVSDITGFSGGSNNKTIDIKEVWFAGSHSDVGGVDTPGKSHQAGNVSRLWMRREAAACGLVLHPTDTVWVPDDVDFGISDSMSRGWRAIEYMPIKQQVSFGGAGDDDARRFHRLQPRRIIPGQKIHASILFANAYSPRATLGEGFDIPTVHGELEDTELDNQIWETGLFDETAAQELVTFLGVQRGVSPIYLDRLLFMLRFKEIKQCVRNVPHWRDQFMNRINNRDCAPLVKLLTIVAYYEVACDPETHPKSPVPPHIELPQDILDDAKQCLSSILATPNHQDRPRMVALLRPLKKHEMLRKQILTQNVLEILVNLLLDVIVEQQGGNFAQAMDGLTCLLQCEDTRQILIEELGAKCPKFSVSRLSRILEVTDPYRLTAALRMVFTLARIPERRVRSVCSLVKPRLRELAREERLVGLLAVEILLALYDPHDQDQLTIYDSRIRANLASALVHLNSSTHGQGHDIDSGQQILRRLFGLAASELSKQQKELLEAEKKAVQRGNTRERTAATMTLLKLCETDIVRTYLCEINLLNVFVDQLQRKDSALLAAYSLVICLKYNDMKESIKDNQLLPKYIVRMLQLNYFADAVGPVEGFQIFRDFMQCDDLREKIKGYNITEVVNSKLGKGKAKEIQTSLVCLDIFRSFDQDGPWTRELVTQSLKHLRNPVWKAQKAGVSILSALAQTEHGVAAIIPRIPEIVEMLLPDGYLPIQPATLGGTPADPTSPSEGRTQVATTTAGSTDPWSFTSPDVPSGPPSWMLGPSCALRILAQNKVLRGRTRETIQYCSLKHLYLSGTLVEEADTSPWRIRTPNRTDVMQMLDQMIKVVDEELSEEGHMSIGHATLPHIQHWDRLVTLLRNRAVAVVTILPASLGVSALAILAVVVLPPVYLSVRVSGFFRRLVSTHRNTRILDGLRLGFGRHDAEAACIEHGVESDRVVHAEAGGATGGCDGGPSGEHDGGSPLGVEIMQTLEDNYCGTSGCE